MASAKKHHYVPQFLLRRFATEDEQITTVRLPGQKRYTSSVVDTGSENRFHTIPQNTANPEALEDAFGELEDSAAPVLVKMEHGTWPLSQGDRITLGAFVTLQALRGPEQRRLMLSLQVAMVEREKQRVEEEGAAKWFARYGVHLTEERAREAWDSAVGAGEPLVTIDAAYHAEQIAFHAETVLPDVLGRVWTLVRFNKPTLFTSDAPVSLDGVSDERGSWGLLNAPSLSLPLGRTLGLVLGPTYPCESQADADALLNGTFDQLVIDNAAWAERLNARTIHNSSRALFHHPDDTALLPEELPDPRD